MRSPRPSTRSVSALSGSSTSAAPASSSELADPKVKYGLIAVGVLIALAVLRKLFADADAPPASIEQCLESRLDGLDVRLARIEEQLHRVSRRPS